ncbi:MAG: DUF3536 domain-containing protein [bacterium]|nr:DUF3536 domain-containing protein [bacterium]
MDRYICIHGHFYQPPRENPWLEEIELQDSAFPYHDWNERVTAECYARNAASRILGENDLIVEIVNNYANISFNVGPTLLAWLEEKTPEVYEAVLEADRESQKRFSGHGSALAQAYNHVIMPLANRRDKLTQVVWGIRDFEHRFGRSPEGMWLPETAVDVETLEILVEQGIRFTILAPHQARRTRQIGSRAWRGVKRFDPTMAYVCRLPSGRTIDLFFYDGLISQAVAFEGLLVRGEGFANRLRDAFSDDRSGPQLVHIATDGETYGHHHRYGEMGLAYALHYIETNDLARVTNYAEFLERHPPTHEVQIVEDTSWSCVHGIERWRADCGCSTGGHPGWNQAWRAPLREGLDWLRDTLAPLYEENAGTLLTDPWKARDDYIDVILDRSPETHERFLADHARRPLTEPETVEVLKLLELQRHAMLMYTSCGWFFSDLSGIETVQVLQYAGRAVQLARELGGDALEPRFLERLEQARSNVPRHGDGRHIYERFVRPAMLDLSEVGAHYAVSSLFGEHPEQAAIGCYRAEREDYQTFEAGKVRLVVGRARFTSVITHESALQSFAVLHFGDHNLNCGVRAFEDEEVYQTLVDEITEPFARADFPEVLRFLDKNFGGSTYSLRSLFRDERRKVLNLILESTLEEAESLHSQLYENHAPLLRFLKDLGIPPPKAVYASAEFVLNSRLRQALDSSDEFDLGRIGTLLDEAQMEDVSLDTASLEYVFRRSVERMAERLSASPTDFSLLQKLEEAAGLMESLPFEVNTWRVQNVFYEMVQTVYPEVKRRAEQGDAQAQEWVGSFVALGEKLSVLVE